MHTQYGRVKKKHATFGFIEGDDGVIRFFIPSLMVDPIAFDDILEGQRVTFEHAENAKGPRADKVEMVDNDQR